MPNDFLLGADDDLQIKYGDFVLGDATEQHQKHLLLANKGEFRQSPVVGVGLENYLNDDAIDDLASVIKAQFELDGMDVEKVNVFDNGLTEIKAKYKDGQ